MFHLDLLPLSFSATWPCPSLDDLSLLLCVLLSSRVLHPSTLILSFSFTNVSHIFHINRQTSQEAATFHDDSLGEAKTHVQATLIVTTTSAETCLSCGWHCFFLIFFCERFSYPCINRKKIKCSWCSGVQRVMCRWMTFELILSRKWNMKLYSRFESHVDACVRGYVISPVYCVFVCATACEAAWSGRRHWPALPP